MSIALQRNTNNSSDNSNRIQRSGFIYSMPRASIFTVPVVKSEDPNDGSCSSSSIGKNSDPTGVSSDGSEDETEVQSSYKGPLDTMDALEEVLPIKQGISKFYNGKSKSFTSLADISSSSSAKDLAKLENPYNRKRKNLLAHRNLHDENLSSALKNKSSEISKRQANFSRGPLTTGVTLSSSDCNSNIEASNSITSLASHCLPPLHPQVKKSPSMDLSPAAPQRSTPWRSFSLSDLQCVAAASPDGPGIS